METYPDALEEKLGFDVVRDRLSTRVQSPLGQERLDSMQPGRQAVAHDIEAELSFQCVRIRLHGQF